MYLYIISNVKCELQKIVLLVLVVKKVFNLVDIKECVSNAVYPNLHKLL